MSGFAESTGTGKQICIPMIPEQVCNDLCLVRLIIELLSWFFIIVYHYIIKQTEKQQQCQTDKPKRARKHCVF